LISGNEGLPAEVCQFRYCIPSTGKCKHDPGEERGVHNAS